MLQNCLRRLSATPSTSSKWMVTAEERSGPIRFCVQSLTSWWLHSIHIKRSWHDTSTALLPIEILTAFEPILSICLNFLAYADIMGARVIASALTTPSRLRGTSEMRLGEWAGSINNHNDHSMWMRGDAIGRSGMGSKVCSGYRVTHEAIEPRGPKPNDQDTSHFV